MRIFSTKKILLLLILINIVLIGLNYLLFSKIERRNQEISKLTQEQEVYSKKTNLLKLTDTGKDDINAAVQQINSYFLTKDDVVPFIEKVETEARAHAISLIINSVGDQTTQGKKETISFRLAAEGSWNDIMYFIFYLEHLPYQISLGDVSLSSDGPAIPSKEDKIKSPVWKAQIGLTVLKNK
jgi:Tfp pilus assembly protein PilO